MSKKELKQSLFHSLSLIRNGDQFRWVTFDEIEEARGFNWWLFNNQKRLFYRKWLKGQANRG